VILLDTTILTYAVGAEHALREPCVRLLMAHDEDIVDATTTIEVIQEFAHVRARRRPRTNAVLLARRFAAALRPLRSELADLELGLTLFEAHPPLGAFDAVLAAVAINRDVDVLVSADRAFGLVPGLRWIDPSSPALDRLIGG